MADKNDNYTTVLLEDINSKLQTVLEIFTTTMMTKSDGKILEEKIDDNTADIRIIKATVTGISRTANDHENCIAHLGHKAA